MNQQTEFLIVRKKNAFCFSINLFFPMILASELQGKTEDEIEMLKTMGFASFDSTKVSYSFEFNLI